MFVAARHASTARRPVATLARRGGCGRVAASRPVAAARSAGSAAAASAPGARRPLHLETPLVRSAPLSDHLGAEVYLKLDCLQPPGSFKIRGIGVTAQQAVAQGSKRIVCSSGGNAGLAAAYAAQQLDVACTVVLPTTSTEDVRESLRTLGADVVIHGGVWDEADKRAREIVEEEQAGYVHPFDQPSSWTGHATLVDELARQLPAAPDAIVTCVGGGGLLMGILEGIERNGWNSTHVIAGETEGAASMTASLRAREHVALSSIDSIAKSLGALKVSKTVFERCLALGPDRVSTFVTSDAGALRGCLRLAADHRLLVEPACGVALAAVLERAPALQGCRTVVVEVCGGASVSLEQLGKWARDLNVPL